MKYLFKAMDKYGEWRFGSLLEYSDTYNEIVEFMNMNDNFSIIKARYKVIPETVCRSTNYKDIEGKTIFWNDVLEITVSGSKVIFDEDYFKLIVQDVNDLPTAEDMEVYKFKVVGNKFDKFYKI